VSSWTKLGAQHFTSTTQIALSRNARLLHIEGLVYAAGNLTNGLIPAGAMRVVTDDPDLVADTAALVAADLWEVVDGGHKIKNFFDDQMSKDDVDKLRNLSRARQRRQRQHLHGDHSGCDPKHCTVTRESRAVTHGTTEHHVTNATTVGSKRSDGMVGPIGPSGLPTAAAQPPAPFEVPDGVRVAFVNMNDSDQHQDAS
jgi:hypothetical protein